MVFPLTGIGAGSTDNDEMAAKIATLEGNIAVMQAQVSGFLGVDNRFHFDHLTARSAEFDYGPLSIGSLRHAANQAIPDNTNTVLTWSTATFISRGPGPMLFSSDATSEIRLADISQDHYYLIWGHIQFASNSSGFREVGVTRHYAVSGSKGDTISVLPAVATASKITSVPFGVRWRGEKSSGEVEQYITVDVKQNSGGALDTIFARVSMVRLY